MKNPTINNQFKVEDNMIMKSTRTQLFKTQPDNHIAHDMKNTATSFFFSNPMWHVIDSSPLEKNIDNINNHKEN